MKVVLKILKFFLVTAVGLIFLAAVAWSWPNLWLGPRTVLTFTRWLAPELHLKSNIQEISLESKGFLKKSFKLIAEDTCFAIDKPQDTLCIASIELVGLFDLRSKPHPLVIEDLKATKTHLKWFGTNESEAKTTPTTNSVLWPPFEIPAFLSTILLKKGEVDLISLELFLSNTKKLEANAALKLSPKTNAFHWQIHVQGKYTENQKPITLKANVDALAQNSPWFGPFKIKLNGETFLSKSEKIHLDLALDSSATDGKLKTKAHYENRKKRASVLLSANFNPKQMNAVIEGDVKHLIPNFSLVSLKACKASVTAVENKTAFLVDCPLITESRFCRFEGDFCEEVAKKNNGTIAAQFDVVQSGKNAGMVSGNAEIFVAPIFWRIKEGKAWVRTQLSGNIKEFPNQLVFNSQGALQIDSFQKIVQLAKNRPWAIPAPFNQLDGTLELKTKSQGVLLNHKGKIPVVLTTRLGSSIQKTDLDLRGVFTLSKSPQGKNHVHLDLNLDISQLRFVLPPLELTQAPNWIPDTRISNRGPSSEKTNLEFTYLIKIQTPVQPAKLITNLTKNEVPLQIKLQLANGKAPEGKISIEPFQLEVFRRKGHVKWLNITFKKDPRFNQIAGEIEVKQADYTIWISLMGLVDQPQINFRSYPPLKEEEVIALLITGRPLTEHGSDDSQSATNLKNALQDRAVGIASMYLLASTPIESISYDPLNQKLAAKVRLADGTSLSIGTKSNRPMLGLRHRLGSNWWINSSIQDPFEKAARTWNTMLEWAFNY